jgi:hypothetical protein
MSRISILNRSVAAAVAVFAALLSTGKRYLAFFPDLSTSAVTDRAPIVLTWRLPWLAPVGHRQPHQADVPRTKPSRRGAPATAGRPGVGP